MDARWEIYDGAKILGPFTDGEVFQAIAGTLPASAPARLLGQDDWQPIGTLSPFAEVYVRRMLAGQGSSAQAAPAPMGAHRVKKIDTLGGGCLIQGFGALVGGAMILFGIVLARSPGAAFIGVVGGLFAVLFGLVLGRRLSTRWTCGACGNPIAGRDVRACPACKAGLS